MNMQSYNIWLNERPDESGTLSALALVDLLDALIEASGRVLRLAVEGTSTRPGPHPQWIEESIDFAVHPFREGSTGVPLSVPELGSTAEQAIEQRDMWLRKPAFDETALSLLAEASTDIRQDHRESDRYDRGVLQALTRLGSLFTTPDVSIDIENEETGEIAFSIDADYLRQAEQLERDTPSPQKVALAGELDVIEYSRRAFKLVLEDGRRIRGEINAPTISEEKMRDLWGKKVTLQGRAHFTPARSVQFIETDLIRPYREEDRLLASFSPLQGETSPLSEMTTQQLQEKQAGNALRKIRGQWPGDESIDELLEALD